MKLIKYFILIITLLFSTFSYAGELYRVKNMDAIYCNDKKITAVLSDAFKHPGTLSYDAEGKLDIEGQCTGYGGLTGPDAAKVPFEVLRVEAVTTPTGDQKVAYCVERISNSPAHYFYIMQSDIEKVPDNTRIASEESQIEQSARDSGERYLQHSSPMCYEYRDLIEYFHFIKEENMSEIQKLFSGNPWRCVMFNKDIPVQILKKINDQVAQISIHTTKIESVGFAPLYQISDKKSSSKETNYGYDLNDNDILTIFEAPDFTKKYGCHFNTQNAIACLTAQNAAYAYQNFGLDYKRINLSYNRQLLNDAGCGVYNSSNYKNEILTVLEAGRIATPNGWVKVIHVANNRGAWFVARAYITCKIDPEKHQH